jgi:hypothetical protein
MKQEYNVFVVKAIDPDVPGYSIPGVFEELNNGKARIGWSYQDDQDLRIINKILRNNEDLNAAQKSAKRCLNFLTNVQPGDYFIYPNQPSPSKFVIIKVTSEYSYSAANDAIDGDFRSYRKCELVYGKPVDISDPIVPSQLRARLGKPGRFSILNDVDLFKAFLNDIDRAGTIKEDSTSLRLSRITKQLHKTIPNLIRVQYSQHDFSRLFCKELFEAMDLNYRIQEGPSEKGSDIVVTISNPLINDEFAVGIQAFAYEGTVTAQKLQEKLDQLLKGWQANALDYGVLLTTGECGEEGRKLIGNHNKTNKDKPVRLIDGPELTKLFLKYFYQRQDVFHSSE